MIRREPFGGIVFREHDHKIFQLDKPSFRVVEMMRQNLSPTDMVAILTHEMDHQTTTEELGEFIDALKTHLPSESLQIQVGNKSDKIWQQEPNPQYLSAPVNVYWSFTNRCNLGCSHCAWSSGRCLPDELTTEESLDVIDQIIEMGACEVSFSGGEPMTRLDQLIAMASKCRSHGLHLGLATNATMIDEESADLLVSNGFGEIQISMEGLEAHDVIRGKGVFERTMRGVDLLRDRGVELAFAVAINKTNRSEVDNIIGLAKDHGVSAIRFVRFIPIGRGERNMDMFEMTVEEEYDLARDLWRKRWQNIDEVAINFNKTYVSIGMHYDRSSSPIDHELQWTWDCPAGRSRLCIMPQGLVAPCPLIGSLGLSGGNVREQSLREIWETSEFFDEIRQEKRAHNDKCASCPSWDECKGGCKASSHAFGLGLMEPDRLCIWNFELAEVI